jgi:hypothetical protein
MRFCKSLIGLLTAGLILLGIAPLTGGATLPLLLVGAIGLPFRRGGRDPLDDNLLTWPSGDIFTIRDMLRSVEVKGITGSGKTSGAGETFINAIAAHPRGTIFGICQKPEDVDMYRRIYARHGKLDKLIVISDARWRCSFIDYLLKTGVDAMGLVEFTLNQGEAIDAGGTAGPEKEPFWKKLKQRGLFGIYEALRLAGVPITASSALEFLTTAAYSEEAFKDPRWKEKMHYRTMMKGNTTPKNKVDLNNWRLVLNQWQTEFPNQDQKVQSGTVADIVNVLHTFNYGIVHEMCSTDTNIIPDVLEHGYSIVIDQPFVLGPSARFIAGGWKYLIQHFLLKRKWNPSGYFTVLFFDEYQECMTTPDSRFLAQSRSHGGCMCTLTQTSHSEFAAAGGDQAAEHKIRALQGQFGTHIFHTSDAETAKFASALLGQRREVFVSPNVKPSDSVWDQVMGNEEISYGISESYQNVLQSRAIQSGLRCGGPPSNIVDGIVIKMGTPFRNGENWMKVAFKQGGR